MATAFSYKGRGAAGAVVTRYNYSPFGETEVMGTDPIGLSQPFRFTGRELDAETGAHGAHRLSTLQPDPGPAALREASGGHAPRARDYSPDMRRFTSEDPIRKSIGLLATLGAGDVSWYRYVGNNPVNSTDPSGLIAAVDDAVVIGTIVIVGGVIHHMSQDGVADDMARSIEGALDAVKRMCRGSCNPPKPWLAGSIGYRPDIAPSGKGGHYAEDTGKKEKYHFHIFKASQDPVTCNCYWNKDYATTMLPYGAVMIPPGIPQPYDRPGRR